MQHTKLHRDSDLVLVLPWLDQLHSHTQMSPPSYPGPSSRPNRVGSGVMISASSNTDVFLYLWVGRTSVITGRARLRVPGWTVAGCVIVLCNDYYYVMSPS